ncbi:MAG: energy-coupling factor ABC transporter ATP-binding protein [Coriobacteriia bacterium]
MLRTAGHEPAIEFADVSFAYESGRGHASHAAAPSLSRVSFAIRRGEFVALIGANGAGKSTASKLVNGLLRPTLGRVSVLGMDTAETKTSLLARHVGYLFQNPDRQICQQTVGRELGFGLEVLGFERVEIAERVSIACETFGLDPAANPFALSRGERQRVALASTLASRPDVVVLDEPTTGLDARESRAALEHIAELNRSRHTTVLMVTHDMDAAAEYASRALVLAEGELVADAAVNDVFRNPSVMRRASLVPPQIHELAARLAPDFPELASITCPCEMASAVIDLAEGGIDLEESA